MSHSRTNYDGFVQVLIDFGLSSNTTLPEDKAVDLHVLERAFTSAHAACGNLVRHTTRLNIFIIIATGFRRTLEALQTMSYSCL